MLKDYSIFAKMGSHGAGSSLCCTPDQSQNGDTENRFKIPAHSLSPRSRQAVEEEKKKNAKKTRPVKVGKDYQAELPELIDRSLVQEPGSDNGTEARLYSPSSQADITDREVESCLLFAIDNMTTAKQVLLATKGDIRKACLMLHPGPTTQLPVYHPMLNYAHSDYDSWSENDIVRFFKSLKLHGKQFNKMSKYVKTKTVTECVQFYYMWKKKCPAKFRRIQKGHYMDHMNVMMFSTHITRETTRRLVAAAAQEAIENVETVEMRDTNVSPGPDQSLSQLLHGSCPQQVAIETVLQARHENVPNIATRSNYRASTEESPTEHPCKPFICSFEDCHMGFHSKYGLYSHMDKHKKRSKTSPPTPKQRIVNDNTATPSPACSPAQSPALSPTLSPTPSPAISPAGVHSRETVFACSQCGREFASIKSRNAHMKVHKKERTSL